MEELESDADIHTEPFLMNIAHDLNDVMLGHVVWFKPTVGLFANYLRH